MDTGDMILKQEVEIGENETTGELWNELAIVGGNLLVQTLEQIENGTAKREKQTGKYSMAPMLDRTIAKIDWENKTSEEIKNLVRGLDPIMGAYTIYNGNKIKIWKVKIVNNIKYDNENIKVLRNGTVLVSNQKDGLYIKTKNGIIQVLEIQAPNAKRMKIQDFLRGNKINEFEVFE